eukprot:1483788-Prymnesium_polylepis.1
MAPYTCTGLRYASPRRSRTITGLFTTTATPCMNGGVLNGRPSDQCPAARHAAIAASASPTSAGSPSPARKTAPSIPPMDSPTIRSMAAVRVVTTFAIVDADGCTASAGVISPTDARTLSG